MGRLANTGAPSRSCETRRGRLGPLLECERVPSGDAVCFIVAPASEALASLPLLLLPARVVALFLASVDSVPSRRRTRATALVRQRLAVIAEVIGFLFCCIWLLRRVRRCSS